LGMAVILIFMITWTKEKEIMVILLHQEHYLFLNYWEFIWSSFTLWSSYICNRRSYPR
jgi:hypothetical protein